jgi:hypothetical protein
MGQSILHICQGKVNTLAQQTQSFITSHQMLQNPKLLVYGLLLLCVSIWSLTRALKFLTRSAQQDRPSTPTLEKAPLRSFKPPERKPGGMLGIDHSITVTDNSLVWEPVEFRRPYARPAPDWNVHTTKPNPYRPFRHGPYHITMGLRNMPWDEWIGIQFPNF